MGIFQLLRTIVEEPILVSKPICDEEKLRETSLEDSFSYLTEEQVTRDICGGNSLHAKEMVKICKDRGHCRQNPYLLV